jgi:enediyne polyketide synthase
VQEQWEGLQLRRVAEAEPHDGWPPALLGPYLERHFKEVSPHSDIAVVVENGAGAGQPGLSLPALRRALGDGVSIYLRPDGKPVTADGRRELSAAHAAGLTMTVAGMGGQGCDLEEVAARPESVWRALLGADGFRLAAAIAGQQGEDEATAATRVWAARECLKKAGMAHDIPLVVAVAEAGRRGDWVVLGAGSGLVATYRACIRGRQTPVVLAAYLGSEHASL